MQSPVWISILRRIPAELVNQLVLVTDSRAEIAVESLFRLEADYAVLRGRLAGTTDSGMLFMVPYDRLTAIVLARELKETEVNQLFSDTTAENETVHGTVEARKETEQDIEITPSQPLEAVPAPELEPKPEAAPRAPTKSSIAARNSLLDRLRAARHVSTGR